MHTLLSRFLQTLVFLCLVTSGSAQQVSWPTPTRESKPWTRWWWMGNAVDQENITRELQELARAGIGGVEITPIYGVQGEEHRFIEFLSPEFSDLIRYTVNQAHGLGMGVDLPPGSGWRCGGPFVPEEKGLWSLEIQQTELREGEKWQAPNKSSGRVAAASFVNSKGETRVLNTTGQFTAPQNGTVYLALRQKNNDKVKRPAQGGEGWAIDTFDQTISNWYFNEFWNKLGIDEGLLRCFFHDSFEYTGDFTPHFTEEFRKRRGYNLAQYLHVLTDDYPDKELVARVKSDYRQTLSDLVLESFIQPMTAWANSHQSMNRNQAHGSPGNILDLYAACDIPETEIFKTIEPGTVRIFVNKFASSAAHVTGQKLVSAESFTWLNEHWTVNTSDMVRASNRLFLAGVNHLFFHGTCYSPADAPWPGWLFYASTQVNNRNPLWRELPALFQYIERSQSLLQQASPQNDLLVYWPYFDVAASEGRLFNNLNIDKGDQASWFSDFPLAGLSEKLTKAGYSFDYISDKQLLNCRIQEGEIATEGKARYKAVVVPKTAYMPLATMQQLVQLVASGAKVFFDESLPKSVPGLANLHEREQQLMKLQSALSPEKTTGKVLELLAGSGIRGEVSLTENGFHYRKMKLGHDDLYWIVNSTTDQKDAWLSLNASAQSYVFMNPMNGEITLAGQKGDSVRIQLESEQALFILCSRNKAKAPDYRYENSDQMPHKAGSLWKVEFIEGGPVFPGNLQTDELLSWTKMGDMETRRFAGTVRYTTQFNRDQTEKEALLDLGLVKDCARVILNGKDFGTLLGPVYKVKVDNLVPGKNTLQVEVTNVAANRIRDLDQRGIVWRKFHDINFVNINYQPFDASSWEIKDAGLLGPVFLIAF
ncbi:glycosyl hydrolase [Sunxiuqinia rutila]|uniref:glycosyl hydrolase n=1 Tax=Sunxiuqinia rutila TaxID=1397841 RepID=UPI003D3613D4